MTDEVSVLSVGMYQGGVDTDGISVFPEQMDRRRDNVESLVCPQIDVHKDERIFHGSV